MMDVKLSLFLSSILLLIFCQQGCWGAFISNVVDKESIKSNTIGQFLKAGILPEKYDGAIYDDVNIVIVADANNPTSDPHHQHDSESAEVIDDEPRLFDIRIPVAQRYMPRTKRYSGFADQSGFQGSAPVIKVGTGVAPKIVASTDGLVPYDAHIDPDFPKEAPVARGLYNVPEGFNLDKSVDYEFRTGYRKASPGQNPSYAGARQSDLMQQQQVPQNQVQIEGPYIMTSQGLTPFNVGSGGSSMDPSGGQTYGSSYGGGSSYGPSYGSGSYGNSGYGGSSYGNMGSGYGNSGYDASNYGGSYGGSNYNSYLQQAAAANMGIGAGSLFG